MENQTGELDPPPSYEQVILMPYNSHIVPNQNATSAHQQVSSCQSEFCFESRQKENIQNGFCLFFFFAETPESNPNQNPYSDSCVVSIVEVPITQPATPKKRSKGMPILFFVFAVNAFQIQFD